MNPRRLSRRLAGCALALVVALTMSSCAGDGVSTGPGVSSTEIVLGVLGDQTGPFKDIGQGLVKGNELWAADVNSRGGVCGRQIRLEIADTSYRPEIVASIYAVQQPRILGYLQVLGSQVNAVVANKLKQDAVTALSLSWSSFILDNPYQIVPGTTYDLELINGLAYLRQQGLIENGDLVGHIYIRSDYGDNALLGSSYYAQLHDLQLQPVRIAPADTDLAGIVTQYRRDGVKAIILSTSPAQTASVVTANKSTGLNVPLLGNSPSFDPTLLNGPAATGLNRLWLATSSAPYSSDVPMAQEIARRFTDAYPQLTPTSGVPSGYAEGLIWEQILKRACESKDLTRAGVQQAFRDSNAVGTDNLIAPLDFSKPGSPATRSAYIAKPDAREKGNLKQLTPLYTAPDVQGYVAPHQAG
jgi:ABC-type branched-subunit amino acid transport system substrate-binding protein